MTGQGKFVEVQGTAEGQPFDRPSLEAVLDLATTSIGQVLAAQSQVLKGGRARS
jgi:ribonuclease PH